MKDLKVANRYATALYNEATAQGKIDELAEDLKKLSDLINENREFSIVLKSAALTLNDKLNVMNAVGSKFIPLIHGLLVVMANNKRLDILEPVIDCINKMIHKDKGEVEVFVSSAIALDEKLKSELTSHLNKMLNKKIILKESVDSGLLNGMRVLVGSKLYDMSVKGKLEALRSKLI